MLVCCTLIAHECIMPVHVWVVQNENVHFEVRKPRKLQRSLSTKHYFVVINCGTAVNENYLN